MEAAMQMAFGTMPQNIAGKMATAIRGMPEPRVSMVDLSGRTNRPAVSEVPITEATRPPEPAVREWDMGGGKTEAVDVYHASPHEFEKFDSGKIGTGEGTQDEGHGLYFAENKAVHESYLRTLEPKMEGGERFDERNPAHIAAQELHYSWNEGWLKLIS